MWCAPRKLRKKDQTGKTKETGYLSIYPLSCGRHGIGRGEEQRSIALSPRSQLRLGHRARCVHFLRRCSPPHIRRRKEIKHGAPNLLLRLPLGALLREMAPGLCSAPATTALRGWVRFFVRRRCRPLIVGGDSCGRALPDLVGDAWPRPRQRSDVLPRLERALLPRAGSPDAVHASVRIVPRSGAGYSSGLSNIVSLANRTILTGHEGGGGGYISCIYVKYLCKYVMYVSMVRLAPLAEKKKPVFSCNFFLFFFLAKNNANFLMRLQ